MSFKNLDDAGEPLISVGKWLSGKIYMVRQVSGASLIRNGKEKKSSWCFYGVTLLLPCAFIIVFKDEWVESLKKVFRNNKSKSKYQNLSL